MIEYGTLTSKGQVTIPKKIRDQLNWSAGIKLKFYFDGAQLRVTPVTVIDEMESLLLDDLMDLSYQGAELETKLLERKKALKQAFTQLLTNRLQQGTIVETSMTNQVELTPGAVQDLKQLDAPVRQFLYTKFVELAANTEDTYLFEKFQYEYCRFDNTLYRVIYKVDVAGKLIIIALVSSGENLYQELAQYIY